MEEIIKELYDFIDYVGSFKYDLIMMSDNRIAVINQHELQFMEWHNDFMIMKLIDVLITSNNNLTDIFNCNNIFFSTDDYIKHYTADFQQFV